MNERIFLAGHLGMVGSAINRKLNAIGAKNIITASRAELDLTDQDAVDSFLGNVRPEIVILAAAKVGGILSNIKSPADFIYENIMIQSNVISSASKYCVKRLVFLGSSCIYPKDSPQPMKEEYLLTGKLEPTNEAYALAKICGIKMAEFYNQQYGLGILSLMPCNLFGPGDSFDLDKSHVLSALVKKFVDGQDKGMKQITLWGTGIARREFMHVDDLADAVYFLLNNYDSSNFLNVGWGKDISIKELALKIADLTKYRGEIFWDSTKPDGMLRKCLDVERLSKLGFIPKISLDDGIAQMIENYKKNRL